MNNNMNGINTNTQDTYLYPALHIKFNIHVHNNTYNNLKTKNNAVAVLLKLHE